MNARILRLPVLVGLCLLLLGNPAPAQNATPLSIVADTTSELERISGGHVEIRMERQLMMGRYLPSVCRALKERFQEAAADPETRDRLSRIVSTITVEGWYAGDEVHQVTLKNGLLVVRTRVSQDAIDTLNPLIRDVLKKVAHLDAKKGL